MMQASQHKRTIASVGLTLFFAVSLLALGASAQAPGNNLQVDYIDVGQGDAIYLHSSDGTDILIDGGPRSAGPTVVAHLQDAGVDDIEVLILTHPDADHEGGLIDVLQSAIPVESWMHNGEHDATQTHLDLLAETQSRGLTPTPAVAGQSHAWGDITAHVLNPGSILDPDENDNSVTLLIVYDEVRFLFTGDITSDAEQALLDTGLLSVQLPADVLKVAHHGSAYSSGQPFLDAVGAEVAVISAGADNPYGHPAQGTLERLAASGAQVLRTDQRGTITVTSDGKAYELDGADVMFVVFLPLTVRQPPPTATPIPTPPPKSTPSPPPTPTPGPTSAVAISHIYYDGVAGRQEPDEYVEIRNGDDHPVQLEGWTVRDEAEHVFTFPSHIMQPGQVCRVFTNEYHPEWCGFSYASGSAIWNNSGDTAYLRNSDGALIDTYTY
jgi:competence protein ComEC